MRAIEAAGFAGRLEWITARHEGSTLPAALVLAPRLEHGACVFYGPNGCELHALGLKPVEGRLALCGKRSVPGVRLEVARAWSRA